jgi:predicted Zn-dependent peptidase
MPSRSPGARSPGAPALDSTYRKSTLDNGIRVVTEEIPYVRSVSFGVWINVGSRDETAQTNGISHFLEHMMFKGTRNYSVGEIARSLESVGGYLNAFTSKEHTCFYARSLDAHLSRAVRVIADLVQNPRFDVKEIEKEKLVILEEIKNIEDDPDDLIHDYFDAALYHDHSLAFPVIGKAENIRRFTRDDLRAHQAAHYVPDRMVIAAAGNIRHEQVVCLVEEQFTIRNRHRKIGARTTGWKPQHSTTQVHPKPITQAHVCTGTVAYGVRSAQRYPLLMLNALLGEGMSSRLFQSLRERYGYAYSVYSFVNTLSDTGNVGIYIGMDANNIDASMSVIRRELDKLRRTSVGRLELQRTKAQIKGSMMLSLESMSSRMMRLGTGEMYYGRHITLDEIVNKIDEVTLDDIHRVANNLLDLDRFSTIIIRPGQPAAPVAA